MNVFSKFENKMDVKLQDTWCIGRQHTIYKGLFAISCVENWNNSIWVE